MLKFGIRYVLGFILLLPSFIAQADVAETLDLQRKRERIETHIEILLLNTSVDSLNRLELLEYNASLNQMLELDKQIYASQQETINRVNSYVGKQQLDYRLLVGFSFIATVLMAFSLYFLYLMNIRLNRATQQNITYTSSIKEFLLGTLHIFSPHKTGDKSDAASNLVIILGLLFMFVSFAAYLTTII